MFFQNFPGLEIAVLKFHDFSGFHDHTNPDCDNRVWVGFGYLNNFSDKNIGAGGWRVDHLFEAVDSGEVLSHSRITNCDI